MVTNSPNATRSQQAPERRMGHAVHYDISYIVQGAEYGTDGAIVLLHDIMGSATSWNDALPQLAALGRGVYAIDMLGYGHSAHPWPADTSPWGHADVLNFLLRDLHLTNIILVGHGVGGAVAQILATRLLHEHVAALALVDSICYLDAFATDWPLPDMKKRQDFDAPKNTKVEDMISDLKNTLPAGVVNTQRFKDVLNSYVEPWNSELGKEVLLQHIRLLVPWYINSVTPNLKIMNKPTLIIWGEQDQQIPVRYGERLHRDIPDSQLVIVPNAGHMILFDAIGAVASAIVDFVKGLK